MQHRNIGYHRAVPDRITCLPTPSVKLVYMNICYRTRQNLRDYKTCALSLPSKVPQPCLDPGRWLCVAGISPVLLVEVSPVGVLVRRQFLLCCVIDNQGLEALSSIMPSLALLWVGEGPLHISYAINHSVPSEVGVPKDVSLRPQLLNAPQDVIAAHRFCQIRLEQHPLLWQQCLQW